MTYDPNANRRELERGGMSASAMAGLALVFALFLGVMIWAFAGDRQTASNTTSPPSTIGQGQSNEPPALPNTRPAPATVPQSR